MARRADVDAAEDLVLALLALQQGLVDPAQLLDAFGNWTGAEDRSMAELLVARGVLDQRGRALLEDLVTDHLAKPEKEQLVSAAGHAQGEVVAPLGQTGPSATVTRMELFLSISAEKGRPPCMIFLSVPTIISRRLPN
jgi:hypothetical protein